MTKLTYGRNGKNGKLVFKSADEFYLFLGIITSQKYTKIFWERNEVQGAWGSEGRIHIYKDFSIFPQSVINRATAGVGNIIKRVNCNELIIELLTRHSFMEKSISEQSTIEIVPSSLFAVQRTVPDEYFDSFNMGLKI